MKRRIIFLDFDGVLNSLLFCEKLSAETTSSAWQERLAANGGSTATREMIDPVAVERLNRLIAETGAEVVVSSSWRKIFDVPTLQEVLDKKGFKGNIIDVTPDLSGESITSNRHGWDFGDTFDVNKRAWPTRDRAEWLEGVELGIAARKAAVVAKCVEPRWDER